MPVKLATVGLGSCCKITDAGLIALATSRGAKLTAVDLSHCEWLTDAGVCNDLRSLTRDLGRLVLQ